MRCYACNKRLSDRESTRRSAISGDFLDLCDSCFSTISDDVPCVESPTPDLPESGDDFDDRTTDAYFYTRD